MLLYNIFGRISGNHVLIRKVAGAKEEATEEEQAAEEAEWVAGEAGSAAAASRTALRLRRRRKARSSMGSCSLAMAMEICRGRTSFNPYLAQIGRAHV